MSALFSATTIAGTSTWRARRMCSRVCGIAPSAAETASVADVAPDRLRYFLVPIGIHVEVGPTLRHRAQVGRVPEHLRQRDERLDDLRVADRVHRLDAPTAAVQVAHDVAEVVLGRRDL